ncbi:MAG TPA: helix-turn-helix domain-containing protein [Actinomycetes bacterium]
MVPKPPRRSVELTDPVALRALAHPTRLALVGLLRREGPQTATQAAERLGESSGSCSFHLRQLAKYGLVEPARGGEGREKPWQATAMFTRWRGDDATPGAAEAGAMLSRVVAEKYVEGLFGWLEALPAASRPWQRAAQFGDTMLYLTPAELTRLGRQVQDLLEPYVGRTFDAGLRPAGAKRVTYLQLAFPAGDD